MPDTPSELQILRKTTTTLELKWRPVKGAVRFEVSIEIETENSQNQLHQTERNGIIIEDLTPGARYSLSVKSVGAENRVNPTPSEKLSVQTGVWVFYAMKINRLMKKLHCFIFHCIVTAKLLLSFVQ